MQEYSFQITMRQAWQDQRLQYENILNEREDLKREILFLNICDLINLFLERIRYLTMTDASKVWMPDTFFR